MTEYQQMIGKEYWFVSTLGEYQGFGTLVDIELDWHTNQYDFKMRPIYVINCETKQPSYFNPETTRICTRYEQLTPKLI